MTIGAMALFLSVTSANAAVMFFNDQAAFNLATTGIAFTVDPFSNDIADADSITFDSGVISTNIGGNRLSIDNLVSGGNYENEVDGDGSVASLSITWTFPSAVTAVGLDYLGIDSDATNITVDGVTRALRESADGDPFTGFFGFTSTTPVSSVTFDTFSPFISDGFRFDNLQFGAASAVSVPVPATLLLFLSGLLGLGIVSRRKQKERAA